MKKDWISRELTMEVVVGVFMVMIFLGLGYFTIILSRETWFGTKYPLEVVYKDIMGLRDGDSVVVHGMPIGKVKTLQLKDDGVHVMTMLDQEVRIREGYRITIVATSILGGRYLNIEDGPDANKLLPADFAFRGEAPYDLMADAAEVMNGVKEQLIEGGVLDNLRVASKELRTITERLGKGEGTLGRLLSSDDKLYEDLSGAVASAKAVAARLEKGEGTLGKLLSGEDELYQDLKETVAALKETSQRLAKGQGTLGKLMAEDDTLYTDLAATAASLKSVAEKIDKGEGMIGRLVNDDGLYKEIESVVHELRATVDDFRETAPITTFTSIFFGAF